MSVLVISKRIFRMDQTKRLVPLLKALRVEAEKLQGFVSRTTYSKMNDPGECIVISAWETADQWSKYMNQKEVKDLQWQVDSLIGEKTVFEIYQPEEF